jgi:hypothetical protein
MNDSVFALLSQKKSGTRPSLSPCWTARRHPGGVNVVVKDGDLVRDDFVGKLYFYLKDIPARYGHDDAQAHYRKTINLLGSKLIY